MNRIVIQLNLFLQWQFSGDTTSGIDFWACAQLGTWQVEWDLLSFTYFTFKFVCQLVRCSFPRLIHHVAFCIPCTWLIIYLHCLPLTEYIVPFCGLPEALLSDHGAHLLSLLMLDICKSLGICKQPKSLSSTMQQCDRALQSYLEDNVKEACGGLRLTVGFLSSRTYRNSPHQLTGEWS